jgi:isoleucyl-tRNA synthetase
VAFPSHDANAWDFIRTVRDDVNKMLECARNDKLVGASLDAAAYIYAPDAAKRAVLDRFVGDEHLISPPVMSNGVDELRTALMLSQVKVVDSKVDVSSVCDAAYISSEDTLSGCIVGVKKASGQKCSRCWFYDASVGKHDLRHSDICQRCNSAIDAWEKATGNTFVRPIEVGSEQPVT